MKSNEFKLEQNYPNPFNPGTTINYMILKSGEVSIDLYNSLGEKVKTLLSCYQNGGTHQVEFNGKEYTSGIYFYNIKTNNFSLTKKMLLLK
jgi:hypothetical protein